MDFSEQNGFHSFVSLIGADEMVTLTPVKLVISAPSIQTRTTTTTTTNVGRDDSQIDRPRKIGDPVQYTANIIQSTINCPA
ncbi:hypothetical protein T02_412 [Trichinella nativa]|uniref:Uncharacterized protein n=1 Tax=Trichinella nativa TaxID=6335 RepID=A0A0V1L1J5_9BILA|nr:hypothetical protein T02_412 [Trichinella nativa]